MRRTWPRCPCITIRGRCFKQRDLVLIRKVIRDHPTWGRTKLSEQICERLGWHQANRRVKDRACRVALLRLELLGYLELPARLLDRGGRPPLVPAETIHSEVTIAVTRMPVQLETRLVETRAQSRLWNALIAWHHYLGLATPVGRLIRYLIFGDGQLLAAISFSECAWNVQSRNNVLREIGFSDLDVRNVVIGNNRFLILPSVRVPNLASRILAQSLRQVCVDWADRFKSEPLVAETFVDPKQFLGTCYLAANWIQVGIMKGYAKRGASHANRRAPKLILLRGLNSSLHRKLQLAVEGMNRRAA